jgi:hypothetical protein
MKTFSKIVIGEEASNTVAAQLIAASQWFTFEPLPDGEYEFTVKAENARLLERAVIA